MRLTSPLQARLNQQQARNLKVLEFLARVTALSLPLYLVIWLGLDLYPLQFAAASQASALLTTLGFGPVQHGSGIALASGFQFVIIPDCTAWKSMLFLFALVMAVPRIPLKKKAMGLAIGLPLVWFANIARIVSVVALQGSLGTETALLLHDTVFQLGLVGMVLTLWGSWFLLSKGRLSGISRVFGRLWKNR
jgi:exosortase/archaeosortase family protein